MSKRAVSLLSGGLDSSTVLAYALREGYDVTALTIDYGQRHRKELDSSRKIATFYGVPHKILKLDLRQIGGSALTDDIPVPERKLDQIGEEEIPVTYVPARNIIFLSVAASLAETVQANTLFIGANALDYSGYPDCRPEFFDAFSKAIVSGTKMGIEKGFHIEVPLQFKSKSEIALLADSLGVPIELTTSCYHGREKACGKCDSCLLRLKGFMEAGIADRIEYEEFPESYAEALPRLKQK